MLLDLTPLKRFPEYRRILGANTISFLGSKLTFVAAPYQLYELTHSSLSVGMLGLAQMAPMIITALWGGAAADSFDRRKLLLLSMLGMMGGSILLLFNAFAWTPQIWLIYLAAAIQAAFAGFHRPAIDALYAQIIPRDQMTAAAAIRSAAGNFNLIVGPAIGGILLGQFGLIVTYGIDLLTFLIALGWLAPLKPHAPQTSAERMRPSLGSIQQGLRYSVSRQELIGSYVVDFVAMVFGMPMALFPELAARYGGPHVLGYLYAAPSVGAMIATLTSRWCSKVKRHGAEISWAAALWGAGIIAFGLSSSLWVALFWLAFAGAADMISGVFRSTLWNQTIPQDFRGRLAGIEMISYMTGPYLGNFEAGAVAALFGLQASIISGGALCIVGVVVCAWKLPRFWSYRESS